VGEKAFTDEEASKKERVARANEENFMVSVSCCFDFIFIMCRESSVLFVVRMEKEKEHLEQEHQSAAGTVREQASRPLLYSCVSTKGIKSNQIKSNQSKDPLGNYYRTNYTSCVHTHIHS